MRCRTCASTRIGGVRGGARAARDRPARANGLGTQELDTATTGPVRRNPRQGDRERRHLGGAVRRQPAPAPRAVDEGERRAPGLGRAPPRRRDARRRRLRHRRARRRGGRARLRGAPRRAERARRGGDPQARRRHERGADGRRVGARAPGRRGRCGHALPAARRDPVAWTGTAISDHVLHYTGASLERLLGDTGFRVLERTPLPTMVYDDTAVWSERCRGWRAAGHLAPPADLLRVLAVPTGA